MHCVLATQADPILLQLLSMFTLLQWSSDTAGLVLHPVKAHLQH
jgi:hypothetical protein